MQQGTSIRALKVEERSIVAEADSSPRIELPENELPVAFELPDSRDMTEMPGHSSCNNPNPLR